MHIKRKLIAAAVGGAFLAPGLALAQMSGTEVYGTVNMAFGNFRYSESTSGLPSVSKWDVANGASNYGVRSRESLGGGLSGWIQIEQNAPLERSNNPAITPASRNSAIGLQGGFGNFFIGQWTTPWADLDALWGIGTVGFWGPVTSIIGRRESTGTAPNLNCVNQPGASTGVSATVTNQPTCDALEGTSGVGHAFWRRPSNAIFYQSNVMAGVQAKLAYQTNEGKSTTATAANASMWSASVQWAGMGGRARVGVAIDRHKDFTTIDNTDSGFAVKGGWNFGVVDVGLALERMTYKCQGTTGQPSIFTNGATSCLAGEGDVKAKQLGVAVAVPVGPGSIRASYSKASDLASSNAGRTDTGAKQFNIGYEHRFSKRTNVGVGYAKIDNKAAAAFTWTGAPPTQNGAGSSPTLANAPLAGSDPSTFFISMTHRF